MDDIRLTFKEMCAKGFEVTQEPSDIMNTLNFYPQRGKDVLVFMEHVNVLA